MPGEAPTPEQIWTGDLFDRKTEAEQLIAYIESVVARPVLREDKRAYTIAIDARYGEGKSFFLKRLSHHMALNHPVAFVDAWADDLADEPLTALAATLKQALEPFVQKPEMQDRFRTFMSKTGKVAKIAGLGLLRRGAGIVLTGVAVDGVANVISGVSEDVSDGINDALKDGSMAQVEEVGQAIRGVTAHRLMEERVNAFEEGKAAVQEMKDSLSAIVESLSGETLHPPIIIVIDELDRCRPTYAIKLLEEIKHLFDVPGLVFILALHADQLAHSVSGAYGSTFDGRAYLRRFIDREYALAEPGLYALVSHILANSAIMDSQVYFQMTTHVGQNRSRLSFPQLIAEYMKLYGLSPRDAFQLIDVLQTSLALSNGNRLHLAYLLPLLIGHIQGKPIGEFPEAVGHTDWRYYRARDIHHQDVELFTFEQLAEDYQKAAKLTERQLMEGYNDGNTSFGVKAINETRAWNGERLPIWDIAMYPRLVKAVARFQPSARA